MDSAMPSATVARRAFSGASLFSCVLSASLRAFRAFRGFNPPPSPPPSPPPPIQPNASRVKPNQTKSNLGRLLRRPLEVLQGERREVGAEVLAGPPGAGRAAGNRIREVVFVELARMKRGGF